MSWIKKNGLWKTIQPNYNLVGWFIFWKKINLDLLRSYNRNNSFKQNTSKEQFTKPQNSKTIKKSWQSTWYFLPFNSSSVDPRTTISRFLILVHKYIAFSKGKMVTLQNLCNLNCRFKVETYYVFVCHLLNLPSCQLHLWQLTFQPVEDENSGKQSTMDPCSLLTSSPPAKSHTF